MPKRSSSSVPASPIVVRALPIAELAVVLSETLSRLSPTRVGILSDQLRAIVRSDRPDDLIVLSAAQCGTPINQSVIAVAVLPERGDTATILHVDWANPGQATSLTPDPLTIAKPSAIAIQLEMNRRFSDQSIRFIQWATDPQDARQSEEEPSLFDSGISIHWWPAAMEFHSIGTLDYLSIDVQSSDGGMLGNAPPKTTPLRLTTVKQNSDPHRSAFEDLVTRTYRDSLDCPLLESFRTTCDILESYRMVPSYSPELWYTIGDADEDLIGCFMLARHEQSESNELVVELVYMGVVPEHRGKGWGRQMMNEIGNICARIGAVRLVLAVDQNNHPARNAYRGFGMTPIFQETVWARSIARPD